MVVQITMSQSLKTNPDLSVAVSNRIPLLESIINGSAATAEWSEGKNWKGEPAILLRLRDQCGARAGADLLPVEFKNEQRFGERLHELKDAIQKVHDWRSAVKQIIDYRNWVAHGLTQSKPAPIAISPAVAFQRLTDFLLKAVVLVP